MTEDLRDFIQKTGDWRLEGAFAVHLVPRTRQIDLPEGMTRTGDVISFDGWAQQVNSAIQFYSIKGKPINIGYAHIKEVLLESKRVWVNRDHVCPICGSNDLQNHSDHQISMVSGSGQPLAFVMNLQTSYDSGRSKALRISEGKEELKKYFPGKEFEILPSRLMMTNEGRNTAVMGEAHVAEYLVIEK